MSQTVDTVVSSQTLAVGDLPPATLVALSAAAVVAPRTVNLCDTTSAAFTVTLPPAASCVGSSLSVFCNVFGSGHDVSIAPASGDDINGSSSDLTLSAAHTGYKLLSIASGQWIAALGL
jgi:hypothetical protein